MNNFAAKWLARRFLIGIVLMFMHTLAFANQKIEIDNTVVNYVDVGQGPTVVLIHGLGADLTRFEHNIECLSRHFRVVALDLPGFGDSGKSKVPYNGKYYVDVVEKLRQRLNLGKITLIGNSMGGWLSLLYAQTHNSHLDSLILIAPAFVFGLPEGISAEAIISGAKPKTNIQMTQYMQRVLYESDFSDKQIQDNLAKHQTKNRGDGIKQVAYSLQNNEFVFTPLSVTKITHQTLIIHGDSDGIVPVVTSQKLNELLPHSRMIIIEQSGHWPQWENHSVVNPLLLEFLGKKSSP